MSMIRRLTAFSLTALALLLTLPSHASAATINVDTGAPDSADSVTDADVLCSPREAVISANQNNLTTPVNVSDCTAAGTVGADTVAIPAGTFTLTLPGEDDTSVGGDLDLIDQTAIQGASAISTILDQNVAGQRVIHIPSGSPSGWSSPGSRSPVAR